MEKIKGKGNKWNKGKKRRMNDARFVSLFHFAFALFTWFISASFSFIKFNRAFITLNLIKRKEHEKEPRTLSTYSSYNFIGNLNYIWEHLESFGNFLQLKISCNFCFVLTLP